MLLLHWCNCFAVVGYIVLCVFGCSILKDQSLSTDVQGHALDTLQDKLNEAEAALRHQQELFHRTEVSRYFNYQLFMVFVFILLLFETLAYEDWKEGSVQCTMFVIRRNLWTYCIINFSCCQLLRLCSMQLCFTLWLHYCVMKYVHWILLMMTWILV